MNHELGGTNGPLNTTVLYKENLFYFFIVCLVSCSKSEINLENNSFINVQEFGSTGNDTSDDSDALLAALDKAKKGNIKKVFLPGGTYFISKTLYISSNIEFFGEGKEVTIIKNHPDALTGLDIITPLQGITSNPDIWSNKTMIATEGTDQNIGTVVENVRIHSLGINWNDIGGGVNSILPVMIHS